MKRTKIVVSLAADAAGEPSAYEWRTDEGLVILALPGPRSRGGYDLSLPGGLVSVKTVEEAESLIRERFSVKIEEGEEVKFLK